MNIVGDRINIRSIELSDKKLLLELINDGELEYNLGGWSFPVSDLEQENWIKNLKKSDTYFRGIIELNEDSTSIGTIIMSDIDLKNGTAELHIKLHPDIQSKGYGTESLNLIINYAYNELRLNCLYSQINSFNIKSQKLFEKVGFIKDGLLRSRIYKKGAYHDVYVYSLLKGEFNGNR